MRLALLTAVLCLMLTFELACLPAACRRSAGDQLKEIEVNGRKRLYLVHVPAAAPERKRRPLLLVFHGGFENGAIISRLTGLNRLADREGFIACYPYGSGRLKKKFLMWNAFDCCGYAVAKNVDDVRFTSALIDRLADQYNIDTTRVYACGYSNGAMFVLRLAGELSDKLAAVASVGGSMSGKEQMPASPVSLLMIHGTDDRHVPYNGGAGKWAWAGYSVNKEPVSYAVDFFRRANACSPEPELVEKGDLRIESYRGGKDGSAVQLITLKGARHNWPGGKQSILYTDKPFNGLDASQECWNFVSRYSKNRKT